MAATAFDPLRPYNDLPRLAEFSPEVETREILKLCIRAHKALSQLKQAGRLLPDPTVLINTLPLLEAQASSEIENIVTTRDALFRQASTNQADTNPATKEALRYRTALRAGFEQLGQRPLSVKTAVEICSTIKNTELDIRVLPGTALGSERTGDIIYTPPEGETVIRDLLDDLFLFLHGRDEIDPLVRIAVAHYQFEAIHPFADGNGRTGRILNILALIEEDLIDLPTLYLSGYINRTRTRYYQSLLAVTTGGAWASWIAYMLEGIEASALRASTKIHEIRAQMERTGLQIRSSLPRVYSRDLIDAIFQQPYCRIRNLVDAGVYERRAAARNLRLLEEIGIFESEKTGRDHLYVNTAFLKILLEDAPGTNFIEI